MRLVTCTVCDAQFDVDSRDMGEPVYVTDVGNLTVTSCEICGSLLVIKLENEEAIAAK